MTSTGLLHQLHILNRSSSTFHDKLSSILYGEEFRENAPNLETDGLVWLVDYLDKVRPRVSLLRYPLKQPQALDTLDPASPAFRKCLRELRNLCGTRMILPTSYTLLSLLLTIGRQPVASGGSGDIYKGTLSGSAVCVKRVRVYSKEGPKKATKVRHQCHHSFCPSLLTCLADPLPGGRGVETLDTPKHRSLLWYHSRSSPTRLGMDPRRGPVRIHQEPAWRGQTWSRRRPSYCV